MEPIRSRNILLVYPEFPKDTYWSFTHTNMFTGKKSAMPPLGLITIAPMFPSEKYNLKLVDMNVKPLQNKDLIWADALCVSAMVVQKESLEELIKKANRFNVPVIAGGPYPTQYFDEISGVAHFVLGEAESGSFNSFLADFEKGSAKKVYARVSIRGKEGEKEIDENYLASLLNFCSEKERDVQVMNARPEMDLSPVPNFKLLDVSAYSSMSIQMSRGCPHNCEFCNEATLFGHAPRLKTAEKMVSELEALAEAGFDGSVFVVDDNFIGDKKRAKTVLKSIKEFQQKNNYPFSLYTEADVSLSLDDELMALMRDSGFNMVFVGLESPDKEVLREMGKMHNVRIDLNQSVKKIQSYGMEVAAGFIVGNDSDPDDICDKIFDFCQDTGIPMAMVGLLTAIKGSMLYERLKSENRILRDSEGNNTHNFELNFMPKKKEDGYRISQNYKILLDRLYDKSGKNYFERCRKLLDNLGESPRPSRRIKLDELRALAVSLSVQSLFSPASKEYRKFVLDSAFGHTRHFPEAVVKAVMGYHFRKITKYALSSDPHYTAPSICKHFLEELEKYKTKLYEKYSRSPAKEQSEVILAEKDSFIKRAREKIYNISVLSNRMRKSLMREYADING
jgi:radical SAM superfamily enzyme YgiQ (UPF0313 family)